MSLANKIPKIFKPFLWSYDLNQLDLKRDKKRIITNVLNLGTKKATDRLFEIYNKEEVKEVVSKPLPGEWNKKSLNFWSKIFDIKVDLNNKRVVE